MWTTSEIKQRGKAAFKLNYWKCVVASLLMGILTAGTVTVSYNRSSGEEEQGLEEAFQQLTQAVNNLDPGDKAIFAAAFSGAVTLILVASVLLKIFIENPLKVGCYTFFKQNVAEPPAELGVIGSGFKNYIHTFLTLFLTDLFESLWTLLFIIPGIIKSYSYRMVPYILAEHPEMSPTEIITRSRKMMDGQKWHAFCYDLSFIGWFLLTLLTLGILGFFWVGPYKDNADAALYLALRDR